MDVWADWCPYCRRTAPELVAAHRRFADRGVRFVSLTTMPRSSAEGYARHAGVPWACGYGAPLDVIGALGAYHSAGQIGGYEAAPTLYVVGPDGRVRWCDDRARMKHAEPADVGRDLVAAIERELAQPEPAPAGP